VATTMQETERKYESSAGTVNGGEQGTHLAERVVDDAFRRLRRRVGDLVK
jgi:hypothetical protein